MGVGMGEPAGPPAIDRPGEGDRAAGDARVAAAKAPDPAAPVETHDPAVPVEKSGGDGAAGWAGEDHLRRAVARAPIVLFTVDAEGIFTLSEGQGLEALGIRPGEHVGRSFFALYRDLPEGVAAMRRALAGVPSVTVEHFRGLIFETRWMPMTGADGTVTGVIGVSSDVTARARVEAERDDLLRLERQARAEVAAQAATLAATFDAITDTILIYDADGRLVHANAAAHAANDWIAPAGDPERPLMERIEPVLPRDADGRVLEPEEWPIARVLRGEVLTGQRAVDTLIRRSNGRDVLLSVSGAPIRDASGRISGGVLVDRDVTERRGLERRTREALDALLAMAQAVLHSAPATGGPETGGPDGQAPSATGRHLATLACEVLGCRRLGIVALEPGSGVQRPLAVAGLSPEQERAWWTSVDGRPLFDPQAPADPAHVARFQAGEIQVLDLTRPPYRDRPNPFGLRSLLIAPLRVGADLVGLLSYDYGGADHAYRDEEMAVAGGVARLAALIIERDRLLRERAEAQASVLALREANRRMDEFLGVASHELRTPLTSLRGNLQLLQRRLERDAHAGDPEGPSTSAALLRLAPFVERALQQCGLLAGLVEDLLDLSQLQAGHLPLRRAPCDLAALVGRTVEERRAREPARAIVLELPGTAVPVSADAERLAQVVDHFLDNALKYSTEEQPVAIGVEIDGATGLVWVRDAGPGIPAAEQARIWDRFYRSDGIAHRSGSSVGLGLGLYLGRTIIERHGGQVGVESAPGAGATFWFRLPLSGDAAGDVRR